jgi:hypothetical protein
MIGLFIFLGVIAIIGVVIALYLNGNFSYTDYVEEKRDYKQTIERWDGSTKVDYIRRITIRRVWDSGKVRYHTKEIKI